MPQSGQTNIIVPRIRTRTDDDIVRCRRRRRHHRRHRRRRRRYRRHRRQKMQI